MSRFLPQRDHAAKTLEFEHLSGPSLAEAKFSARSGNLLGAKDMVYLCLELLECSVACQERLACENGFATRGAPTGQGSARRYIPETVPTTAIEYDCAEV